MDSPNYQFDTETEYKDGDRGTGAWAIKPGPPEVPGVPLVEGSTVASEDFEGTLWTQIAFGSGDWATTSVFAHSGTLSYTNADIDNSQSSEFIIYDFYFQPQISFWLKTDTEANFDKFRLFIDGVQVYEESGDNDWHRVAIPTGFGFEFKFRYTKDSSVSSGTDACYVDDIVFGSLDTPAIQPIPARPFVYTPLKMTDDGECLKVALCDTSVSVTGTIDTRALDCEIDSVTICPPASGGNPFEVAIVNGPIEVFLDQIVAVTGRALDCELDSITVCAPPTGGVPFEVTIIDNLVPVSGRALDCDLDSVTICQTGPLEVTIVDQTQPVTGRPLDCAIDSVTICQDSPLEVTIIDSVLPVSGRALSCALDSVEICNDAGNPITVKVIDTILPVSGRALSCATDSIEICNDVGNPISVTVLNSTLPVSGRALSCATDSIEICNDVGNPITVTVLNTPLPVSGTITMVPGRRTLRGLYYGSSGALAYTSAADAATGGDLWIVNTSSTVVAYIREIRFTSNIAALALLTALPRINMERMTFTGTPSGAQITPAKRDSTDPANTATVRIANTGMTITAGAVVKSFSPPSSDVIGGLLAANASSAVPVEQIFLGDLDSYIVLRQNEGIVFRQASAGAATENRVYNIDFTWEEI